MPNPSQADRLEAFASHLLDGYLHLRERFALLKPMHFDRALAARRGAGKQARGYLTLRNSLFLTCVQDVAKFAFDKDRDGRTPSVGLIVGKLTDDQLIESFRERYAATKWPVLNGEGDPAVLEAVAQLEASEEEERRLEFDKHWRELQALWIALAADPALKAFKTIRDTLTAHTEVRLVGDRYAPTDIADLGIKWSDLEAAIMKLQRAVALIGFVVRSSDFAWDHLERLLTQTSDGFWAA